MRILLLATMLAATAAAQTADPPRPEATVSVEARASALIPGSSQRATKSVPIPYTCTYVSHHMDVLERLPPGRADNRADGVTSYAAELRRSPSGHIDSVALTVVANVPPSMEPASIGVRLSVVMRCD